MEKYNKDKYVLVTSSNLNLGYSIGDKNSGSTIIEDNELAKQIINKLLKEGCEIFDDVLVYHKKYPPKSQEEQKALGMLMWWYQVPKKDWPKLAIDYFENDSYWKEFYIKYDVANSTLESFL